MDAAPVRVDFAPDLLSKPKVLAFDCGDRPWEKYITDWLFGRTGDPNDSAVGVHDAGGRVWLYVAPDGSEVVGVSSFGECRLNNWPTKKSPPLRASVIPALGVDRRHQNKGVGRHIMSDLLAEAVAVAAVRPALVAYVDEESPAARWYVEKFNFAEVGKPFTDAAGRPHKRLVLAVNLPATGPS